MQGSAWFTFNTASVYGIALKSAIVKDESPRARTAASFSLTSARSLDCIFGLRANSSKAHSIV